MTGHWPYEPTLTEIQWRGKVADEILDYAAMTQVHMDSSGDGRGACLPFRGDRCDITSAMRVLAQRVRRSGPKTGESNG